MPSLKHIHKYQRKKLARNYKVYACALPDCSHYISADLIVGKKTICWVCGRVTIIYKDSNGVLARPHCKTCTKRKTEDEQIDLPPLMIPEIIA